MRSRAIKILRALLFRRLFFFFHSAHNRVVACSRSAQIKLEDLDLLYLFKLVRIELEIYGIRRTAPRNRFKLIGDSIWHLLCRFEEVSK